MSLINQVLSDLKKRGSAEPDKATLIHPVTAGPRDKNKVLVAGGILVLAAVAGGALWATVYEPTPEPPHIAVPPSNPQTAAKPGIPLPLAASQAAASSVMQGGSAVPAQPASAALAQSAPAVQVQPVVALNTTPAAPESDTLPLRPSFELASQPAPVASVQGKKPSKAHESEPGSKPAQKSPKPKKIVPTRPTVTANVPEQQPSSIKQMSRQQQAEGEYNQAADLMQQGHGNAARPHLENALQLNPAHAQARLMLATLLLENKRNAEAETVLQDGLHNDPTQAKLSMLLARIQVERGALPLALETLRRTLPYAEGQPDYQAFMAAILQRQNAHEEAAQHYQAALRLSPNAGVWWMGLGISLQALKRKDEARDAFKHAIDSGNLSAELQDYVKQRMKDL